MPAGISARAAVAVVASCGLLFGASYAGAKLTGDDGDRSARSPAPAPRTEPPAGRSLKLAGAAGLPGLRKPPHKPKVDSATSPAPAVASAAPAPPPSPSPPAPAPSGGSGGAPAPNQDAPQTTAGSSPPPPTEVYDDG